jgi:hypothetical protein
MYWTPAQSEHTQDHSIRSFEACIGNKLPCSARNSRVYFRIRGTVYEEYGIIMPYICNPGSLIEHKWECAHQTVPPTSCRTSPTICTNCSTWLSSCRPTQTSPNPRTPLRQNLHPLSFDKICTWLSVLKSGNYHGETEPCHRLFGCSNYQLQPRTQGALGSTQTSKWQGPPLLGIQLHPTLIPQIPLQCLSDSYHWPWCIVAVVQ